MPIKSKAQRRKFAELLVKGEISEEVFERWNRGAGSKELPERLHPEKAAKPKRRKTRVAKKKKAAGLKTARKKHASKRSVRNKAVRKPAR